MQRFSWSSAPLNVLVRGLEGHLCLSSLISMRMSIEFGRFKLWRGAASGNQ